MAKLLMSILVIVTLSGAANTCNKQIAIHCESGVIRTLEQDKLTSNASEVHKMGQNCKLHILSVLADDIKCLK